jgi:ankyrin repeat protein
VTVTGVTPVRVAVQQGNTAAVQTLLEHGAKAAAISDGDDTLLVHAVKLGNASIVELIVRYSKQPAVAANTHIATAGTVLHLAACSDKRDVISVLLRHGAAENAREAGGVTPLIVAATCASVQCVQLLLDAGADISAQDQVEASVLHAAVNNSERPEVLQLLLEQSGAAEQLRGSVQLLRFENCSDELCSACIPQTAAGCWCRCA